MSPRGGNWLAGATLVALWGPLAWRLAPAWRADPELAHGWAVPALALYLAWERRADAPAPRAPNGAAARWWALPAVLGALGAAASLPVLEPNPSWPAAGWVGVLAAALATFSLLAANGGRARAAAFAGPVLFAAAALPWPTMVRAPLTLGLADANAFVAAELVSAAGRPAVVDGRVIEVATGRVGVDEACSGVRSLQTVTMAAVFFVLLFRLRGRRAAGLVAGALGVALLVNLARTCWLTWIAATEGIVAMESAHDAAGAAGLVTTLLAVAVLGWRASVAAGAPPAARRPRPVEVVDGVPALPAMAAVLGVMLAAEAGTRAWYSSGDYTGPRIAWELAAEAGARPLEIPSEARALLGYSRGGGFSREDTAEGRSWLVYLFHWEDEAARAGAAFLHDPTICLPAIGLAREADLGRVAVEVAGEKLELEAWRFRSRDRVRHVFFARWDGARGEMAAHPEDVAAVRWRQVREARRRADLHQLIVSLEGAADDADAIAALRARLPELLLARPDAAAPARP